LAGLSLLLTGPLILLVAAAIKIESAGPAFVRHRQPGLGDFPGTVLKFRCESEHAHRTTGEPELTSFGWFLRASGLEEMPQMISVLIGHRSIVGIHTSLVSAHRANTPMVDAVISCAAGRRFKPGMTSLFRINNWQNSKILPDRIEEWAKDEFDYMQNWSIWLDVYIILKTVRLMLMEGRRQM